VIGARGRDVMGCEASSFRCLLVERYLGILPRVVEYQARFSRITCFHVGIDSKYRMLLTSQASSSGSSISQDGPFETDHRHNNTPFHPQLFTPKYRNMKTANINDPNCQTPSTLQRKSPTDQLPSDLTPYQPRRLPHQAESRSQSLFPILLNMNYVPNTTVLPPKPRYRRPQPPYWVLVS
jgi:hypothetical protein